MFDGDSDDSSADSQQESLCHLCEKSVTKIAWTKFAKSLFIQRAPNWRLEAEVSLESRCQGILANKLH